MLNNKSYIYLFHIFVIENIHIFYQILLQQNLQYGQIPTIRTSTFLTWSIWPYVMTINPKHTILRTTKFTAILKDDGVRTCK